MKKRYYGWNIALVCLGLFLIGATLTVTLGVFFPAITATHGFTQAEVSLIVSFFTLGSLASAAIYKKVVSKMNLKVAVLLFTLFQAAAVVGMSMADSLQGLYLLGFIAGFFGSNLPMFGQLLVTNWFDKKRGTAMAVVISGVGINQIIIMPILVNLIAGFDYKLAFLFYAGLMVVIGVIGFLVIKESPKVFGLEKDGVIKFGGNVSNEKKHSDSISVPLKKAIFHKSFFSIQIMHQLINVVGMAIGLQLTTYLTNIQLTTTEIASFFALLGVISFFSRFLVGILLDVLGLKKSNIIWGISGIIAIVSLLLLPINPTMKFVYMIFSGGGLAYTQIMTAIAYARFYGDETFPQIQAVSKVISSLCTAVGVVASGVLIDQLGFAKLYQFALIGFVIAVIFGHIAMTSGTNLQKKLKAEGKLRKIA
ncbi:MFS transporter [Acidaminobacter sp. JC074]|uniref:MFS transporter n=1 Tax=Acidaminobacter sp. JC074 TaxID=2530199 RepID=UPI001F1028D6|nr:MFS transporter [Acidaminobacter sp. JC074]MCH4887428.1 MFS transporter [Acidaminobacter sp. JC074]